MTASEWKAITYDADSYPPHFETVLTYTPGDFPLHTAWWTGSQWQSSYGGEIMKDDRVLSEYNRAYYRCVTHWMPLEGLLQEVKP